MKNRHNMTSIVNYLYIVLAINYKILVDFIIHIDSTGYGMIFLSILVLFLNQREIISLVTNKPIIFWLIWSIFAFLNYLVHPHPFPLDFFILIRMLIVPLVTMIVVVIEYNRDANGLLWVCFFTYLLYGIGGFYYDLGILNRDINENDTVLGNTYAITCSFIIFFGAILNRKGKLPTIWYIIIAVIAVLLLATSGTRKAFGAGLIFVIFWGLSFFYIRKIKTWIFVVVFAVAGWYGYNYIIENTFMGARMEVLERQMQEDLPINAPQFLSIFGDRAAHYYYGVLQFFEHPLFGEGLYQARVHHGTVYFHSEPIAQLADNGIVGFYLFFSLYYWVVKKLWRRRNEDVAIGRCMFGGLAGMFFLMLTTWAWEFPAYFICLGVLIGYSRSPHSTNSTLNI